MAQSKLVLRKLADRSDGERLTGWVRDPSRPGGLRRSRVIDPETAKEIEAGVFFGEEKPWPTAGWELVGDPPEEHRFSTSFVDKGIVEKTVSISDGKLRLHLSDEVIEYEILEAPNKRDVVDGEMPGERDYWLARLVKSNG